MTEESGDMKNRKRRGEWAELRFMADAAQRGLRVSKPWGDSEHYDVGVEHNGQYQRVQIKSVLHRVGPAYRCSIRTSSLAHPYKLSEVDFFAVYLIPEGIWYILPAHVVLVGDNRTLSLTPSRPGRRYESYKEAWHLLLHRRRATDGAGVAQSDVSAFPASHTKIPPKDWHRLLKPEATEKSPR